MKTFCPRRWLKVFRYKRRGRAAWRRTCLHLINQGSLPAVCGGRERMHLKGYKQGNRKIFHSENLYRLDQTVRLPKVTYSEVAPIQTSVRTPAPGYGVCLTTPCSTCQKTSHQLIFHSGWPLINHSSFHFFVHNEALARWGTPGVLQSQRRTRVQLCQCLARHLSSIKH